jgi:hypothetical protein
MPHLPPGTSGLAVAVAVGVVVWLVTRKTIDSSYSFTFEHGNPPQSFEPRLAGYMRCTETLIGLATGSIVLLAGSSVFRSGGRLPWIYASPLVLMGFSVIYGVFFLGIMNFFYEGFLHNRNSYAAWKYRLVNVAGFSALFTFAVGYIWLAFAVANN